MSLKDWLIKKERTTVTTEKLRTVKQKYKPAPYYVDEGMFLLDIDV